MPPEPKEIDQARFGYHGYMNGCRCPYCITYRQGRISGLRSAARIASGYRVGDVPLSLKILALARKEAKRG